MELTINTTKIIVNLRKLFRWHGHPSFLVDLGSALSEAHRGRSGVSKRHRGPPTWGRTSTGWIAPASWRTGGSVRSPCGAYADQLDELIHNVAAFVDLQSGRWNMRLGLAVKARSIGDRYPGIPDP